MQNINKFFLLSSLLLLTIIAFCPLETLAASFQSLEQSAARLGNADAGTATNTDDAAIEFNNPAGMPLIKHTAISVSGIGILGNIDMRDVSATNYNGDPISGSSRGPESKDFVPAFHIVKPITDKLAVGFGENTPYGLDTIYKNDSLARYFATKSNIETINLGFSFGYLLTHWLSIGAGLDIEWLEAELDQAVDANNLPIPTPPPIHFDKDFLIKNKGDDWSCGFNAGLLLLLPKNIKIGFTYRAAIKHNAKGESKVYNIPNNAYIKAWAKALGLFDRSIESQIELPDSFTLSLQRKLTERWTVMADIEYTLWHHLRSLTLKFPAEQGQPENEATITLNYHNVWRLAIGQSYIVNKRWTLRTGLAFDQTPTDETYKTARIPGANRYWITAGINYKFARQLNLDLGYAFILFEHSHINLTLTDPNFPKAILKARYHGYAQLIGAQINFFFKN